MEDGSYRKTILWHRDSSTSICLAKKYLDSFELGIFKNHNDGLRFAIKITEAKNNIQISLRSLDVKHRTVSSARLTITVE